jgi:hypothetical protein
MNKAGPQADAERTADAVRIAGAERLRRQRRHGRHQPHAEGEADEVDGMRQRRRGHGLAAETADQGNIGRHHRDLAELRQRDRDGKLQCLGELGGEMMAARHRGSRRDRCGFDFV